MLVQLHVDIFEHIDLAVQAHDFAAQPLDLLIFLFEAVVLLLGRVNACGLLCRLRLSGDAQHRQPYLGLGPQRAFWAFAHQALEIAAPPAALPLWPGSMRRLLSAA